MGEQEVVGIIPAAAVEGSGETVEEKIAALQNVLGADEAGELTAQLWRAEKANSPREFLDELQLTEVRLAHIKRAYGGGSYAITVHGQRGRLVKSVFFRIAGSPRLETAAPVQVAAVDQTAALIQELREERRAAEARQFELTKLMLTERGGGGGGGGGFTFADMLAVAKMIGEKERTASPVEMIREAKEMMGLIQGDGGGGGADWSDLAAQGLAAFTSLMNQPPASPPPAPPLRRISAPPVAESPAAIPAELLKQIAAGLSISLDQSKDDEMIVKTILESSPGPLLASFLPVLQAEEWEQTFKPYFEDWAKKKKRLVNIRRLLLEAVSKKGG